MDFCGGRGCGGGLPAVLLAWPTIRAMSETARRDTGEVGDTRLRRV